MRSARAVAFDRNTTEFKQFSPKMQKLIAAGWRLTLSQIAAEHIKDSFVTGNLLVDSISQRRTKPFRNCLERGHHTFVGAKKFMLDFTVFKYWASTFWKARIANQT